LAGIPEAKVRQVSESRVMAMPQRGSRKRSRGNVYTSKIIKAGALLADTRTLLSHWDLSRPPKDNLARIRRENLFGKASRSRVEDILAIFRQRYLAESAVTRALVILADSPFSSTALDRIFYFHSAKSDDLLRDVVVEVLLPRIAAGTPSIDIVDVERALNEWVQKGRTAAPWGDATIRRVAQGLLATLRDFGVLEGAVNKRIGAAYLPVEAFAYIMFYLRQHQPSGVKLIDLIDWKLFFLSTTGVERFLFEAHQKHLLEYHAAGSVTRLTFPASSLEEYANVLAKRSH
jgi:hypothetical protein